MAEQLAQCAGYPLECSAIVQSVPGVDVERRDVGRAFLGGALEPETRYLEGMSPLKARVENGRLKLDEPTDLPEGQVIELIPLDEVISTEGDDLDDEERAALHRSIDESIDDEQAGNVEDLSKVIAELRAQL